jgi:hypothetical protein
MKTQITISKVLALCLFVAIAAPAAFAGQADFFWKVNKSTGS